MTASPAPVEVRGFRLSPQQRRLWVLAEADGGLAYRAVALVRVAGRIAADDLAAAAGRAAAGHEVLRTVFRHPRDLRVPVQVILQEPAAPIAAQELPEAATDSWFDEALREPFAFADGPLVRVAWRSCAAPETTWLLLSASTLCLDGEGLRLLARGIAAELEHGSPSEEPLQYADLAEWQNAALEGADGAAGREIWARRHAAVSTAADLPWTRPPAPGSAFEPEAVEVALTAATAADLVRRAEAAGHSLGTLLLAAWAALLGRLTRQPRITVGSVFAGRHYEELAAALGTFARTLPLVVPVAAESRLEEVLHAVAEEVREAAAWQECFAWEQAGGPSDPVLGPPFAPFGFSWDDGEAAWAAGGRAWEVVRQISCGDRFVVQLHALAAPGGDPVLSLRYDPERLDAADAARLAERLATLLSSVTRHGLALRVAGLEIVGEEERGLLAGLAASGPDALSPAAETCVHRRFEEHARSRPEALALVCGERLTAAELGARANRLAHHLRRLGVGPEVPVALFLERTPALVVALLAVLKAGGYYVPIDPGQPVERLAFMLSDSGAAVLLTQQRLRDLLPPCAAATLALDTDGPAFAAESDQDLAGGATPANAAYAIYTSGSTGMPKRVVVEHRQLAAYVAGVLARLGLPAGASFATVSTFAADLGHTAVFPALATGGALHVVGHEEASDPAALAARFAADPVDCMKIVPSHLRALLRGSDPQALLPRRRLVLGGEAADQDLIDAVNDLARRAAPDLELFNHYGPTETTVGALAGRLEWDLPDGAATPPLGRPLPGVRAYLLDATLELAPAGAAGEVFLGGRGVSRGYGGRPDLTAARFLPDPFDGGGGGRLYRTGDLARWLPCGDLEFLGRIDQQVKIHGNRVEPGEVEAALMRLPAVAQAAVVPRTEGGGLRLVAYLVAAGGGRPLPAAELRELLRDRLPEPMIPSAWVWLPALPLTPNGKLDRRALPAPERTGAIWAAPRNREEEILASIWQEVLGVPRVGVHDNFFDLGGDSILSIQIIARAARSGLRFTPKQVFQHQTVAGLVAVASAEAAGAADQGEVSGAVRLTPIQRRYFARTPEDPAFYNQALLLALEPSLDAGTLARALAWLPGHHDALRLRFVHDGEEWRQEHAAQDVNRQGIPADFHRIDLSALPPAARLPLLERASGEAQRGFSLSHGPLWRAVLFDLGAPLGRRLLLAAHHLLVDGVSWRILHEDLEMVCADLTRGEVPRLPAKTTSYQAWSELLGVHAEAPETLAELSFWTAAAGEPARLPVDDPGVPDDRIVLRTVTLPLEEETTSALLREAPAALGAQANELLVSALGRALAARAGGGLLLMDLEGHGREDLFPEVDLSRSVGWFTALFPVWLRMPRPEEPAAARAALEATRATLREVPQRGIRYGILRYLSPRGAAALAPLPAAELRFNYLGQANPGAGTETDSLLRRAFEPVGPLRSPRGRPAYLLDVVAGVGGGRLWVSWTYGERLLSGPVVQGLAESFFANLRELVALARQTSGAPAPAGDFPLAGLDSAQLEKVLRKVARSQETA